MASCCRCPRCGRLHVLGAARAEEGGRCACGAQFWVEGRGEDDPRAGDARQPPERAEAAWVVEADGTTRAVFFF